MKILPLYMPLHPAWITQTSSVRVKEEVLVLVSHPPRPPPPTQPITGLCCCSRNLMPSLMLSYCNTNFATERNEGQWCMLRKKMPREEFKNPPEKCETWKAHKKCKKVKKLHILCEGADRASAPTAGVACGQSLQTSQKTHTSQISQQIWLFLIIKLH